MSNDSDDDVIYTTMQSPIGRLTLTGDGRALTSIFFERDDRLASGPPKH
jgi:hypothetical protein